MSAVRNLTDNLNKQMADLVNVVRAHDAVHPDRNVCGGVGGCLLMMTEHDAREQVTDTIEYALRSGYDLRVRLVSHQAKRVDGVLAS